MTENNEQQAEFPAEKSGGTSRRTALKMGIATGVGIAAWSGPTITSLGGTPAYAAGCTFAIDRRISGADRNTDQSSGCVTEGGFGYHQLSVFTNMPSGFLMFPDPTDDPEGDTQSSGAGWNSQVCSTNADPYELILQYPSTLNCQIQVEMYKSNGELIYIFSDISQPPVDNGDGTSEIRWRLPNGQDILDAIADLTDGPDDLPNTPDDRTPPPGGGFFPSNTRYAIFLRCIGGNAPPECFDELGDPGF